MDKALKNIYKSGLKFLTPLSLEETCQIIVREAIKLISAKSGSILLMEDGELKPVYSTDPTSERLISKVNLISRASRMKQPVERNSKKSSQAYPEVIETSTGQTAVTALFNKNTRFGLLGVGSNPDQKFSTGDLDVLALFGAMASLAIRKAQIYNELMQALDTRDLFIAMASHELRTPLTSINGYVQLLNSRMADQDTTEARWVYELMRESHRLTELVKELLEINRIKSGELHYFLREQHLKVIISRSIKNFKFAFPDRSISLDEKLDEDADLIIADFEKLVSVFGNVLENAAKYSPDDSVILVSVKSKGRYLIIRIKDNGWGIYKDDLSKIFKVYFKGQNHRQEGIGIGLYLVSDILKRHRGLINITSKVGRGTCVEIKLLKARYN